MTSTAFLKTVNFYTQLISYGKYTISGVTIEIPLHKIEAEADNKLAIYLLIDHQTAGIVTCAQLFDIDGDLFDEKIVNIEKDDIQGVLVKFTYEIKEVQ